MRQNKSGLIWCCWEGSCVREDRRDLFLRQTAEDALSFCLSTPPQLKSNLRGLKQLAPDQFIHHRGSDDADTRRHFAPSLLSGPLLHIWLGTRACEHGVRNGERNGKWRWQLGCLCGVGGGLGEEEQPRSSQSNLAAPEPSGSNVSYRL